METIVLLAHGSPLQDSFSHPNVKIVSKGGEPLSDDDVREYVRGASAPEYASSPLGSFRGMADAECSRDLGVIPEPGPGFVDSGKRRGGALVGQRIFVLRGMDASFEEVGSFARGYRKVILLACRG